MITEILPGVYQAKLPFPNNPLRDCNVYIVKGSGRSLIVDSGIDTPETRVALLDDIRTLAIDLSKAAFFLTHIHIDHTGNVGVLAGRDSVVYCSRLGVPMLDYNSPENREKRTALSIRHGFPPGDMMSGSPLQRESHPMRDFAEARQYRFDFVEDGQVIGVDGFAFRCVETSGHAKGHVCLYEPDRKILLCGDHILQDISPNISTWQPDENPLAEYLSNLEKVSALDVKLVLPGHRRIFKDPKGRIDELRRHHEWRAEEALSILRRNGRLSGYQIAAHMTWDVSARNWEEVPIWQRMFATGEAIAHLRCLAVEKRVHQDDSGDRILFSASAPMPALPERA